MTGPIVHEAEQLFDVILSRPGMAFGAASKLSKSVLQRARILEGLTDVSKQSARFKRATALNQAEQFLMPQGHVIPGGISQVELAKRLSVKPVIVGGVDKTQTAMRDLTGTIRMNWEQGQQSLSLELPSRVTDEQVKHLSRFFDNNQIPTVNIIDSKGNQTILNTPLGAHVEDALFNTAKDYAKKSSRITPEMIAQYKKEGVFKGQAGLLDDGSPVEIRSKTGEELKVFDFTANREFTVHESKMSVLPTTLEDQIKPNNIFSRFLSDEERTSLVRLRQSLGSGLGTKITKFSQLERLAGTRGLIAERLPKGQVGLKDITSGESQTFENLGAAVTYSRNLVRPAPDLTPDIIKAVLGEGDNIGFSGPNGGPPQWGETIPTPRNIVYETRVTQDLLPGAGEHTLTPTRGLLQDLQERTRSAQNPDGIPFGDIFLNVHQATVLRQNFNARWIHGKGVPLPNGTKHLDEIYKMAGHDPDVDAMTHWLESKGDSEALKTLESHMSPKEIAASKELRKFYDELYKEFGITEDFVADYAPHLRVQAQQLNTNDFYEMWRAQHGDAPMPKAMEFVADYHRTGLMEIYDTDALRVASRYVHAGSSKRFMSEPLDQVENLLHQVNDRALMKPMNEYMLSLRGFEHIEQKQMIERTLNEVFNRLPGFSNATAKGLAEKTSDLLIGVSYMSTLAFRPASVLRNYGQVLQTLFPIFGTANGAFVEGLGRAATRAGKLAAVEDGAISYKSAAVFGRQEIGETTKSIFGERSRLKKFADAGFRLYDTADEYTRAASYWVGRENASRAISRYMQKVGTTEGANTAKALDKLLLESKAFMFEKNIQKEFLRRLANNPESAARFIGVQTADVTQFLYGRGMQPFWMRSVWGKFLGQYGTWPLWYFDNLHRTAKNFITAGHTAEAVKFLGRHAIVNAAILYAGHEVLNVDLSRWLSYPSLFFSGGPGAQVAVGAMQLFRGLGDVTAGSESPYAQSHLTEGINTLANAGLAYIPFHSAARDFQRVGLAFQHGDWTEFLGAMLGAQPTHGYRVQQQLDALFPGQPLAYEEFGRYRADAPQGPSASAIAELEAYRERAFVPQSGQVDQFLNPVTGPMNATPSMEVPAGQISTTTGNVGGPPTGLLGQSPAGRQTPQLPQAREPAAESEPLQR